MIEESRAFYKGDDIKFTTSDGTDLKLDVKAEGYTVTTGYQCQSRCSPEDWEYEIEVHDFDFDYMFEDDDERTLSEQQKKEVCDFLWEFLKETHPYDWVTQESRPYLRRCI
jgi:hypothetical protein